MISELPIRSFRKSFFRTGPVSRSATSAVPINRIQSAKYHFLLPNKLVRDCDRKVVVPYRLDVNTPFGIGPRAYNPTISRSISPFYQNAFQRSFTVLVCYRYSAMYQYRNNWKKYTSHIQTEVSICPTWTIRPAHASIRLTTTITYKSSGVSTRFYRTWHEENIVIRPHRTASSPSACLKSVFIRHY